MSERKKLFSLNREAFSNPLNLTVIILAFIILLGPVLGPLLTRFNWGFNALNYLPKPLYYIWFPAAAVVAALFIFAPREHFISALTARYLWGDRKIIGRLAAIIIALAFFFLFKYEAHFFGNGYIRVANLTQRTIPVFRWFEFGDTYLAYLLFSLLEAAGTTKIAAAMWAYQILSFIAGLVYISFSFKFSESIFEGDDDRLLSLLLLLFSGLLFFFFGLVENYPILLAVAIILIYLYAHLSGTRQRKYLYFIWALTLIGMIFNFQIITFIPANLYLTFKHLIKRKSFSNFLGSLSASVFILAAVIILYFKAIGNLPLSSHILFLSAKLPDIGYWMFSFHHLMDIFNLTYMIIPVFLIFIFVLIMSFKYLKSERIYITLGFLTISQLLYLLILDPRLGMARDFPMFGLLLTGLLAWGIFSIIKSRGMLRLDGNTIMTLAPLSLLIILPSLYIHLHPPAAEKYLDNYITCNETKTEAALYAFRDYYVTIGENEAAVLKEKAISKAPGALESQLVNDLYAHERFDESFEYALRLVERYPYVGQYRMQIGNLLKHYKRYGDAERELKAAIKLDPYRPDFYHFLSELYREMRLERKCFEALGQGIEIDPRSTMLLIDLAGYSFRAHLPAEVDSLTDLVMTIDSTEPYALMYKGLLADQRGQKQAALNYFERFVGANDRLPEVPVIRKRMNSIVLELRDTTSAQ
ncbi:MAG: hypothetical protein CVT49_11150 [candidate division Zixibacteria bacterium HGW-Zixibacteria-1]|nr:MAG: hypothetical protein CVT49_11150 [candidate division Zixibacteria bacterium HGW-Zixibacteria-1]